jgi:PAS domain S-box-containing protein
LADPFALPADGLWRVNFCDIENHFDGFSIKYRLVELVSSQLYPPWSTILPHARKSRSPETPDGLPKQVLDPRFHLAAIVASSDEPIISKDLNGIITSWNEAAERIFGYKSDEIVGRSILQLIPPELHYEEDEILGKLRAGKRIDHYETTRMRRNGDRFPVSVTISPIEDESGRVIGASKIARDISGRKQADESRFRLAAIVDSADDAIISKDLNGVVITWNDGARRTFGYDQKEMIGQPILRLIPSELQYEEDEILRKLRAGERVDHYETRRTRKDGSTVEVSVTISPIKDESGRVIGASKIARDISDRKRMERLLVEAEKIAATGRMAAAVAHEINNPLEAVMNLIYLARQTSPASGNAHQYLTTAEEELGRVSHIARQTLGYYRDTTSPTEVYLHDLIENVLTIYRSRLLACEISVDTRFNDLQKILVSRGEFIQIFSNLIANAVDAMANGGALHLSARTLMSAAGDGVQVIVRDTGIGIKQEHLERIVEPFFTTKGNLGTGIGLWVTKQLVEKRGGRIWFASNTEPGRSGTVVTVFVPFATPAAPKTEGEP